MTILTSCSTFWRVIILTKVILLFVVAVIKANSRCQRFIVYTAIIMYGGRMSTYINISSFVPLNQSLLSIIRVILQEIPSCHSTFRAVCSHTLRFKGNICPEAGYFSLDCYTIDSVCNGNFSKRSRLDFTVKPSAVYWNRNE